MSPTVTGKCAYWLSFLGYEQHQPVLFFLGGGWGGRFPAERHGGAMVGSLEFCTGSSVSIRAFSAT